MKVFLSWSGDISKQVAETLRDWLPNVIQALDPWMSAQDVEKGARWSSDLFSALEDCTAGVICVTPENTQEPWLNFEAGALAKTVQKKALVCPYLVGLRPNDLTGPLVEYQATEASEDDTRKLVKTLNGALPENNLPDEKLEKAFDRWWPDLDSSLKATRSSKVLEKPQRSDREILEEILALVRESAKKPFTRSFNEILADLNKKALYGMALARAEPPSQPGLDLVVQSPEIPVVTASPTVRPRSPSRAGGRRGRRAPVKPSSPPKPA